MKSAKTNRAASALELVLPATSANLGPAFDAAALAFAMFLKVRAQSAAEFSITALGRDPEICGRVENHLILTTYREVLHGAGKPVRPLALDIDNQIPIGKGCGSSAAARLAGIALAVHFGKLKWTDSRIVGEASRREHHPDNAAACWMGGLAVAKMSARAKRKSPASFRKGIGRCCWRSRRKPWRPKKPAACCRRNIPGQTRFPTFRIPCCCWRRSCRAAATCWRPRSKTACISPIAQRCVRYCRRCKSSRQTLPEFWAWP